MLHPQCFDPDWLRAKREELKVQDLELLERTVHAFALLHGLIETGLDFVFKGGTCMLLLPTGFRRLSIDIDIQSTDTKENVEKALVKIGATEPFYKWEENDRAHDDLPQRSHHEFSYNSKLGHGERKIILDVVHAPCPLKVMQVAAEPAFLQPVDGFVVSVPTVEALLGDKLIAFAPNTTGVPFQRSGHSMAMQVVKQLHDVHQLAQHLKDPVGFRVAYSQSYEAQNNFRKGAWSLQDVAADTVRVAWQGRAVTLPKAPRTDVANQLASGKRSLGNHLLRSKVYQDTDYQTALATAAALAVWAGNDHLTKARIPVELEPAEKFRLGNVPIDGVNAKQFKTLFGEANVLWAWMEENGVNLETGELRA